MKVSSSVVTMSGSAAASFSFVNRQRSVLKARRRIHLYSIVSALLVALFSGCSRQAQNGQYFGATEPPAANVLRYVSGSEPESLDPQIGSAQNEARIHMALFEGLVEYDPETLEPIPGIATSWDANPDLTEFVFHLRENARWSNGEQITAQDFVYSIRRGLSPELASRSAYLAYYIVYAKAFNGRGVFVRDPATKVFLLEQGGVHASSSDEHAQPAPLSTPREPLRLVLPGEEAERNRLLGLNHMLRAAVAGKDLVPVTAEDVGVEALGPLTLKITLNQPAPFFVQLLAHQFFRVVSRRVIEAPAKGMWTLPERMVSSGPFMLQAWEPYNKIVVVKNPFYWDAERVRLDKIVFYPVDDQNTIMNLYKAGQIDATYNHQVPAAWYEQIRELKDYMDAPEASTEFYSMNVTRPPMNDRRVRRALNLAIDKRALAAFRRPAKALTAFTPSYIFPDYETPSGDDFDPDLARQLLAEAGYRTSEGNYDPNKFPVGEVEIFFNSSDQTRAIAEFIQAQWQHNLTFTVPLRTVDWRTFVSLRSGRDYSGLTRDGWAGDYVDPFSFLSVFSTAAGENNSGWYDDEYVRLLDEANRSADRTDRLDKLSKAESYLLDAQPVIPLLTLATNWLKKPYVKGMYANAQTLHPWKFVYVERDRSKW
jgi:oligopeptide transport system substrate-binding protein